MNRREFVDLRNAQGKRFVEAIQLRPDKLRPSISRGRSVIESIDGRRATATISFNRDTLSKTINVHVPGLGPICRLDVDGAMHADVGRCHKHEVLTVSCSTRNLPSAVARPDLAGRSLEEVFRLFCVEAGIAYPGRLNVAGYA